MRVRTAKRLALLIGVVILVGITGFFTQRYQLNRLAQKELEKAELAYQEGEFARAETLFREHLRVFPEHQEIQIRYADALLKASRSLAAQAEADAIYSRILKRSGGLEDVRKKLIDLKFEMGRLVSSNTREDGADVHVKILLDMAGHENDPHLLYLMGQCEEAKGNDVTTVKNAVEAYRKVVEQRGAPDRIKAGERLATLLRDKLNQPKEAQVVIDKLVEDAPDDYRGYLARGRFWLELAARDPSQKALESEVTKDFARARKLAPSEPDVYLQQASSALIAGKAGYETARGILRDGLKHAPTSRAVYEALAGIEIRADNINEAIKVLELGVKGIELKLLPALEDVNEMPASGKNLIVVAAVKNVLHFRIFDVEGNVAADTEEKKLVERAQQVEKFRKVEGNKAPDTDETKLVEELAQQVEKLRKRLEILWATRSPELTKNDKDVITREVASIVGDKRWSGQADQGNLRLQLTELLAKRGDTGKLLLQIEELKKAGYSQLLIQYFSACYYINSNQFLKARQILITLQAAMTHYMDVRLKSRISVLLAQCYGELGEPEMQQGALLQALGANPQDLTARLNWINNLVSQGDRAGAIREYQAIVKQVPRVRPMLARLLIEQNQRRPEPQRKWSEVSELINEVDETGFESGERAILRAELLVAQGDQAGARDELEKARSQFPKSVEIRIAQASLAGFQGKEKEALGLLDQAKGELGDRVDLRLERARLWSSKKGPQVLKVLMDLSQDVDAFSKIDQKRLLNGLALELVRQQDLEGASRLWTRLATQDPANIGLRLNLLDLALQSADKDGIEKNIKQIEEIEGNEGLLGRYCQVRYLIWQAQRAGDKDSRQAIQAKARDLLEDLVSRRGDWSVIPLASAELAEQELAQSDVKDDELRAKEESIINFYLQAIKLGQRRAAVVRRTVQLLFKTQQGDRALELLSNIPMESQLAGEERQAVRFAVENRDFPHALQIARRAVQANPGDFNERIWLVQILLAGERQNEAAKELRDAVNLAPSDPDRWIALVTFQIFAKQMSDAAGTIKDAEAKLPSSKAPLALALCCEKMGRAYDGTDNAEMKKWNDAARSWYEKAQAAEPANLSIKRRLTDFFLQSRQTDEAQKYLEAITRQGSGVKNAETKAWANRQLALVLASGTDRAQASKALAIFEPDGKPVPAGQEGKILERKNLGDPEDLRVLSRVLDLQRTVVHRKRAIEILETLADKNLATSEDRFTAARLYEAIGEWQKAREKYRELNLRTRNLRDMETFNRRPFYIAQSVNNLLRHCKAGDTQDLAEAQELVDELKQLQPAALGTLVLQVEIYRIRNEIDRAVELIQAFVSNPKLVPDVIAAVGDLAEKIKQIPLAEQLFRRLADLPDTNRGKIRYAAFLGRQGRIPEALKICEPLWNGADTDLVGANCIEILFGSDGKPRTVESGDIDRVSNLFDQAIAQAQNQHLPTHRLLVALGNLREKQDRISEAEILYQRAIQEGDGDGVSLNNLAWLLAVSKDSNRIKEALDYANRAIALKPDQPDFLDTRGIVYLVEGRPKLAIDDLQRAVAIDSSSPAKYFHLAQAYLAIGDKNRARQALDMSKTLGLTRTSLHPLERQNYQNVLETLGSP
jgi:tetratricopeptide (TPR) repeat protein